MVSRRHSCFAKIRRIFERTGILMTHDEITQLCQLWNCQNPEEFYRKLDSLSDEQLRAEIEKVRKKRKILFNYLASQEVIYG
jgi:hypothetical protein